MDASYIRQPGRSRARREACDSPYFSRELDPAATVGSPLSGQIGKVKGGSYGLGQAVRRDRPPPALAFAMCLTRARSNWRFVSCNGQSLWLLYGTRTDRPHYTACQSKAWPRRRRTIARGAMRSMQPGWGPAADRCDSSKFLAGLESGARTKVEFRGAEESFAILDSHLPPCRDLTRVPFLRSSGVRSAHIGPIRSKAL
jgi:hypothetical protein